jgi:hypothetical protein
MTDEDLDLFLVELGRRVDGDPAQTINMWDVGQDLDLERDVTESLATRLMGQGYLEVRTLDGKVGLTAAGTQRLASLVALFPGQKDDGPSWREVVADIEATARDLPLAPSSRDDFLADLGCLKLQLGKTEPLMTVLTACARSLARVLADHQGRAGVADLIHHLDELGKE